MNYENNNYLYKKYPVGTIIQVRYFDKIFDGEVVPYRDECAEQFLLIKPFISLNHGRFYDIDEFAIVEEEIIKIITPVHFNILPEELFEL